jgi:hypothetical protein
VPPEFFDDEAIVCHSVTTWPSNWRPSLENVYDAHVQYVHRDSLRQLLNPISQAGPRRPRPEVVNGRALFMRNPFGRQRTTAGTADAQPERPYQESYPLADMKWPLHRYRLLWTWMFTWVRKQGRGKAPFIADPEWGNAQHLPSMFRTASATHIYTRWVVPTGPNSIRLFYFHSAKRNSWFSRQFERLWFHIHHDWSMNYNFSGQDGKQIINSYYDTPEKLSATDVQTIEWRKLLLTARGMNHVEPNDVPEAEAFAEDLEQEMRGELDGATAPSRV